MLKCLEIGKVSEFPIVAVDPDFTLVSTRIEVAEHDNTYSVICICRMPVDSAESVWTCSNEDCPVGIFHFTCMEGPAIGISCPLCRK